MASIYGTLSNDNVPNSTLDTEIERSHKSQWSWTEHDGRFIRLLLTTVMISGLVSVARHGKVIDTKLAVITTDPPINALGLDHRDVTEQFPLPELLISASSA